MQKIKFLGMPSDEVKKLQNGTEDANDQVPEQDISDGDGLPCRHCLNMIDKDEPYLILSHRPFSTCQPYAEQGPIFLHANKCKAYEDDGTLPSIFNSPAYIVRGYDKNERIVYGTGSVVERNLILSHAESLLTREDVLFLHIRSASNNCWQGRIERF